MYAQSLPSRRNTQEFHVEGLPEEHSLLNRWMVLIGDTFRAVKSNFTGALLVDRRSVHKTDLLV